MLKIFLVQDPYRQHSSGSDELRAFVIITTDEQSARYTHPATFNDFSWNGREWVSGSGADSEYSWSNPEDLDVVHLGNATPETQPGIVLRR